MRKHVFLCKIDTVKGFRSFYQFMMVLAKDLCTRLCLPVVMAELAFKLYLKTAKDLVTEKTSKILPVLNYLGRSYGWPHSFSVKTSLWAE